MEKKATIAPGQPWTCSHLKHLQESANSFLPATSACDSTGTLENDLLSLLFIIFIYYFLSLLSFIRLYSSTLKVYSTLDLKAWSKMLSKSMFEEGEKS